MGRKAGVLKIAIALCVQFYGGLFGSALNALATTEPITHLTLSQTVDIAIRNATNVIKGENDVSLTGELLLRSYGQFLPNLTLTGTYGYSSGTTLITIAGYDQLTERSLSPNYTIGTAINLFNGLSDYSALRSALARREASLSSVFFAKQQVMLDIIQTYLQVTLDSEFVLIAQKNLAASQSRLKLLQTATQVGSTSIADLYRQQAQTSSDELLLYNTQARLNDDQALLVESFGWILLKNMSSKRLPWLRHRNPSLRNPTTSSSTWPWIKEVTSGPTPSPSNSRIGTSRGQKVDTFPASISPSPETRLAPTSPKIS